MHSSSPPESTVADRKSIALYLGLILKFLLMWQFVARVTDTAVTIMLKFIKLLVRVLGTAFISPNLIHLSNEIPLSLHKTKTLVKVSSNSFECYIVCPKCNSVYKGDDFHLVVVEAGEESSAKCPYTAYPRHTQISRRAPCVLF